MKLPRFRFALRLAVWIAVSSAACAADLNYSVSWLGNSFSGASNKWVQNFFIHTKIQPDGTVNTWSHWDEGGKKFGVYRTGEYLVFVEENYKAKSLICRWRP